MSRRGEVWAQGMTLDICPTDYGSFPENAPPLTCGCSAAAVKTGTVWGTNPYYYQSALCRAALHAGAIGAEGGQDCGPAGEVDDFSGGYTQRRIRAASSGSGKGFRVIARGRTGSAEVARSYRCRQPKDAASNVGHDARDLPDRLRQLPRGRAAADLRLLCCRSEDGQRLGRQSLLLSVGAVPRGAACRRDRCEGGQIVVQPEKSAFFPAVSRNGVRGRFLGRRAWDSASRTAGRRPSPPAPVFDAATAPD